jgi:hypothetical protein
VPGAPAPGKFYHGEQLVVSTVFFPGWSVNSSNH